MHSSIIRIAEEFSRKVPDNLVGTRAAVFYLMAHQVSPPQSVRAQVGAAFGRVMRTSVTAVKQPNAPATEPQMSSSTPTPQDDFVFASYKTALPGHA